jgi:hypothetical protein
MNITRIRQNFLNNKVFEIIPDITKMTNKGNITDESLIKLFKLDKQDIQCIEKYKVSGEGRLTDSEIKYFKNWKLDKGLSKSSVIEPGPEHIPDVEGPIPISPKPKKSPKSKSKSPKPKKTINKSKCSPLHPAPVDGKCPKDKPYEKNGCCQKTDPKTKKKKGGHRHRRNKRSRRKSRKRK